MFRYKYNGDHRPLLPPLPTPPPSSEIPESNIYNKVVHCCLVSVSSGSRYWLSFNFANRKLSNIFQEKRKYELGRDLEPRIEEFPGLIPDPRSGNYMRARCAAILSGSRSTIYLIGVPKSVWNFHYLDLDSNQFEESDCYLRIAPAMPTPKVDQQIAVITGKLYVMGGNFGYMRGRPDDWGEVFDPFLNMWKPMPPPPLNLRTPFGSRCLITAVLEDENKILMGVRGWGKLFAFEVETETWQVFDPYFSHPLSPLNPKLCFDGKAVVVRGIMYCWCRNVLYAYHLKDRWTLWITPFRMGFAPEDCVSIEEADPRRSDPFMLHVGGDEFCLIWMRYGKFHALPFFKFLQAVTGPVNFILGLT